VAFGQHLHSRLHLTRPNVPQLQLELVHLSAVTHPPRRMFSWKPAPSVGVAATAVVNRRTVIASLTGQGRHLRAAFSACLSCTRHEFPPCKTEGFVLRAVPVCFCQTDRVKWSRVKSRFVTFQLLRFTRYNLIHSVHPRL
jgi:hypothetical protein